MRRLPRIFAALSLVASVVSIAPTATAGTTAPIEPSILRADGLTSAFIHAHPGRMGEAMAAAESNGIDIAQRYETIDVFVAIGTSERFRSIATSPAVEWIEANRPIYVTTDSSHAATRSEDLYKGEVDGTVYDGSGVGVAVIDTGVDGTIPALQPALGRGTNLKILCPIPGAVVRLATVSTSACPVDTVTVPMEDTDTIALGGHGTHVAGIIAGAETSVTPTAGGNAFTVHGAAPGAALYSLGAGAALSVDNAMDGLEWVLDNHDLVSPAIKVVNNSWGTGYEDYADPDEGPEFFFEDGYRLHRALWKLQDALVAEGVTLVFAAGNSGGGLGAAPATTAECINPTPGVICVANYNDLGTGSRSGVIDGTSSRGQRARPSTWPDISAPGTGIVSTCRVTLPVCDTGTPINDEYFAMSGTSMAAPHVAGIVAQMLQADPTLSPAQIEEVLEDTAHKFRWGTPYGRYPDATNPDDESSFEKGHGLVDARAAVERASTPPEPAPGPDPIVYMATGDILGQAVTSFFEPTVASQSSVTRRAFEATCSADVPPVDGFVFPVPEDLANGRNVATMSGSNLFGLWDLNMWLYDSDCTLIGSNQAGIFGDVSMRLPEGTAFAVATNHFFGITTVGLTIQPPPLSFIASIPASARYNEPVSFGARAAALDENALVGAPITFTLEGEDTLTWSSTTGSDGIALVDALAGVIPGTYQLVATYTGNDESLAGISITRPFEVEKQPTVLSLVVEGHGSRRVVVASLDGGGSGIADRTIEFLADGTAVGTAQTDGSGVARFAVPDRYRGGNIVFTARFCGDGYYEASNC